MAADWDSEAYALLSKVARIATLEAQTAFLDEACAGNQPLRQRVEQLLKVYQQAGSFLDYPAIPGPEPIVTQPRNDPIGAQIGAYKILQEIGEGGFGMVYMAEQHRPVRRKVALKIIKPGMDSREVIARFEAEQQALAMMDHPNIARVLDAGTTDNGRPYFAMELVKGVPINEYCDKNNMPLAERLRLFVTVCRAVQHAHQKAVIHRDLKPSNIMVTLHDGKPVPKVIDFGVAKALNQQLTEKTLFTHYGQMVGTPQYMSPEQAEMSGLEVDTRSDIYSLGVLLYEMLTGTTPLTAEQLRATGFAEIQRVICEDEPPTPSTRLSTLGEELTVIASHRQSDPGKLRQQLHGELDWIVMKSLDKDRARRYETASAFASDIEAYLDDEPVHARPPSVGYLLGKTLRKHRALAVTSAIVALILVAATVISTWQAIHAYEQRQIADEAKAEAETNLHQAQTSAQHAKTEADKAESARRAAEKLREESERLKEEFSRKHYASDMDLASKASADGRLDVMNQILQQQLPELRGFDWHHWWLAGHLHRDVIFNVMPLWGLAVSPDGELVATSTWPQITRLYRTKDAALVGELPDQFGGKPAFSPDGKSVVTQDVSGRKITVWGLANGALVRTLDGHHDSKIVATAFSPARSPPVFAAGDESGRITVWDASNWQMMGAIAHTVKDRVGDSDQRRATAVRGLTFASSGDTLVAGADSGDVVVYDVATHKIVAELQHAGRVRVVAYSPNTGVLATTSAADGVKLWDSDWISVASLPDLPSISAMAFSADGQRLVVGTEDCNSILVWNLDSSPELLATIQGHRGPVYGVAFVGDSNTVWSASRDGTIRVWDLRRCEPFDELELEFANGARLAYTPDGRTLMVLRDGGEIRRWDIGSRQWGPSWNDGEEYSRVALSQDGDKLAGVTGNVLYVWDVDDPERSLQRCNLEHLHLPWNGRPGPPMAVTRDGSYVAQVVTGVESYNYAAAVVDVRTGNLRCRIPSGTDGNGYPPPWAVFSPDESRLAVRRFDRAELWDITIDPPILEQSFQGHGSLRAAAFSPGGQALAVVNGNAQFMGLFDIASGTRTILAGHTGIVNCLAFSRDGAFLISGGNDGTVRMWDAATGQLRSTFDHQAQVTSVAVSPTGDSIASLGRNGTLRIWKAATASEVMQNVDDVLERADSQDRETALTSLNEAIKNNPNNWKLFTKRGDVRRRQRNWTEAMKDYNRAISLRAKDGILHKRRAEMRLRVGQRPQAVEDYITSIQFSPLLSLDEYLREIRDTLTLGEEIVPEAAQWRNTTTQPPEGWQKVGFDDSDWSVGRAPFGLDTSLLELSTEHAPQNLWWDDDIWLRYAFTRQDGSDERLILNAYVNDTAELFINGVPAAQIRVSSGHWREGVVEVASEAKLVPGENVLAVHCRNRIPYGYGKIDVGLYLRADRDSAFVNVLERAIRQSPQRRRQLYAHLADQYLLECQWIKAGECFQRLVELSPYDAVAWMRAAALSVYTGNLDRYYHLCSEMLSRFARTKNPEAATHVAKACLLAPPREFDLPAIHELADRALAAPPDFWGGWFMPYARVTKALAEYRSGDDHAAVECATRSIAASARLAKPGESLGPIRRLVIYVEALARARLGEHDSASEPIAEFQRFVEEQSPFHTGDELGTNWHDWLICEILLREVTQEASENKTSEPVSAARFVDELMRLGRT